jgi:hypothetical protein
MCNICDYPTPNNHPSWIDCMAAWRAAARESESRVEALESEAAGLRRSLAIACTALAEVRSDLALKLYATAECDADAGLRAAEGRG